MCFLEMIGYLFESNIGYYYQVGDSLFNYFFGVCFIRFIQVLAYCTAREIVIDLTSIHNQIFCSTC